MVLSSFETAKNSIDESINDDRFDEYEFDLFGGEPFLDFELVKQIVEYVITAYPTKKVVFMATTNGTLVHGEIKKWLKDHSKIFVCSISMDGTREMHNINRTNSFDKIDFDFFAKTTGQSKNCAVKQATAIPDDSMVSILLIPQLPYSL